MLGGERRVSESCTTNKRRERGKVGEGNSRSVDIGKSRKKDFYRPHFYGVGEREGE